MLLPFTIFMIVLSLAILVKGADYLVDGASDVARWLKVPPLVVGLTIVALGTSLPEFIISFFSALAGKADLAIGNVIGSNIANIGLVLGVCAILTKLRIKSKTLIYEFPFLVAASFLLLILANDMFIFEQPTFVLGRLDGVIFLTMLIVFLTYLFFSIKGSSKEVKKEFSQEFQHNNSGLKNAVLILVGIAGLFVGGKVFVTYAGNLAGALGFSDAFIGLTIAALGTSLPELAASGMAAWKGKGDIAIGNVVGSNIFNILFVLGVTSVVSTLPVNPHVLGVDGVIMIFLTLLFVVMATRGKDIRRWEGISLLSMYVLYIGFLIWSL